MRKASISPSDESASVFEEVTINERSSGSGIEERETGRGVSMGRSIPMTTIPVTALSNNAAVAAMPIDGRHADGSGRASRRAGEVPNAPSSASRTSPIAWTR